MAEPAVSVKEEPRLPAEGPPWESSARQSRTRGDRPRRATAGTGRSRRGLSRPTWRPARASAAALGSGRGPPARNGAHGGGAGERATGPGPAQRDRPCVLPAATPTTRAKVRPPTARRGTMAGIAQSPAGSIRPRAAREPRGATGTRRWSRSGGTTTRSWLEHRQADRQSGQHPHGQTLPPSEGPDEAHSPPGRGPASAPLRCPRPRSAARIRTPRGRRPRGATRTVRRSRGPPPVRLPAPSLLLRDQCTRRFRFRR